MNAVKNFFLMYWDGLRSMTWGRQLWIPVIVKLLIIFLILRLFFFQPVPPTIIN